MTHHRSYEPPQTQVQTRDGILFFILVVVVLGLTGAMSYRVGRDQQEADDQFAAAERQKREAVVIAAPVPMPNSQLTVDLTTENDQLKDQVRQLMRDRWALKEKAAWMEPYLHCESDRCLAVVEVKDK